MKHDLDRGALSRVIAVINGKGGVFKTSLVANVGGLLAEGGSRVLLVDLDPQGNLAEDLGYADQGDGGRSLAASLCFGGEPDLLTGVRANLDVIAGGPHLDDAAAFLGAKAQKDRDAAQLALAKLLASVAGEYDLVLLDCPPGNEPLQAAAVAAARYALVPLKTDMSSRKGVAAVAARMDSVVGLNPISGPTGRRPRWYRYEFQAGTQGHPRPPHRRFWHRRSVVPDEYPSRGGHGPGMP